MGCGISTSTKTRLSTQETRRRVKGDLQAGSGDDKQHPEHQRDNKHSNDQKKQGNNLEANSQSLVHKNQLNQIQGVGNAQKRGVFIPGMCPRRRRTSIIESTFLNHLKIRNRSISLGRKNSSLESHKLLQNGLETRLTNQGPKTSIHRRRIIPKSKDPKNSRESSAESKKQSKNHNQGPKRSMTKANLFGDPDLNSSFFLKQKIKRIHAAHKLPRNSSKSGAQAKNQVFGIPSFLLKKKEKV